MRTTRISRALLVTVAFVICALGAPVAARASYYTDAVNIHATVRADGSLSVKESRSLSFDDEVNGMFWELPLAQNAQGLPSSIRNVSVSERTNNKDTTFSQVNSAENGESGVYTITQDSSKNTETIKVFTPHEDGDESTITVSYILDGAVMAWNDTAELYWKFVGPGWSKDSNNVTLTVAFQSGDAAQVQEDKTTLRAWGHGPLNGEVSIDAHAPELTLMVPQVSVGEFAEVRATFPTSWVPQMTPVNIDRMDTILQEEKQWAQQANEKRAHAQLMQKIVSVVLVAVSLVFAGVIWIKRIRVGKTQHPQFSDTYFRDIPSDDHPAVVAAFMQNETVSKKAFLATLMWLSHEKIIGIVPPDPNKSKGFIKKASRYCFELKQDVETIANPIDRAAADLYFPQGGQMYVDEFSSGDNKNCKEAYDNFKAEVSAELERRNLIVSSSTAFTVSAWGIAVVMVLIGLNMAFAWDVWLPFLVSVVLIVAGCVGSLHLTRRTQEGIELYAKYQALKRWLEDFTRLEEAVPGDVVLWDKLLVMGVALGVSDRVLESLAQMVPHPEVDESETFYVGSWWWLMPHQGYYGTPLNSMNSAYETLWSTPSSAGGFGGGFSGGGGGGVGGGGGGSF